MQMTPVTPPDERKAAKTGWLVGRAGFKCIAPIFYSVTLVIDDFSWLWLLIMANEVRKAIGEQLPQENDCLRVPTLVGSLERWEALDELGGLLTVLVAEGLVHPFWEAFEFHRDVQSCARRTEALKILLKAIKVRWHTLRSGNAGGACSRSGE